MSAAGEALRLLEQRGATLAVAESLTVDQVAHAFTVYPSMSGSIAEAARRLHRRPGK